MSTAQRCGMSAGKYLHPWPCRITLLTQQCPAHDIATHKEGIIWGTVTTATHRKQGHWMTARWTQLGLQHNISGHSLARGSHQLTCVVDAARSLRSLPSILLKVHRPSTQGYTWVTPLHPTLASLYSSVLQYWVLLHTSLNQYSILLGTLGSSLE